MSLPPLPPLPCADEPAVVPAPGGTAIGNVRAIALRPVGSPAPVTVRQGAAVPHGLADDRHADALSPRQILLAGAPAYDRHALPPHTLRENLLLDADTAGLTSGTLLRVGSEAVLVLTFGCEACGYLDIRQPGIAARIGRDRGMLARVVHGGPIRVGDPVVALPGCGPLWADDWRARVAAILARVPPGMVVEYRHLARLAGVQAVYCRAFPRLVRSLGFAHAAVRLAARPEAPRWQGEALFAVPGH